MAEPETKHHTMESKAAIDRLIDAVTRMIEAYASLIRMELSNGISKSVGILVFAIVAAIFTSATFFFINITVAISLGHLLGGMYWLGFLLVSCFYVLLTILMFVRTRWVVRKVGGMVEGLLDLNDFISFDDLADDEKDEK